jgi:very-short-patch-repair endonuclease
VKHEFARKLRREQTSFERRLWSALRNRKLAQCKFRRQQPIGPYVVDFVSFERNLVIELDGSQHGIPENASAGRIRTAFLKSHGFRVLRFWNSDLRKLRGCRGRDPPGLDRATPHPRLKSGAC